MTERKPRLCTDEDGELLFLYGLPVGTPAEAAAHMQRLAPAALGLWLELEGDPELVHYRPATHDEDGCEEVEVLTTSDDPRGQPVWRAFFAEVAPPSPCELPGPTYGELHPGQMALA